jgi:hypothetical protein
LFNHSENIICSSCDITKQCVSYFHVGSCVFNSCRI